MKYIQLTAGQRYVCGSKMFLEGMPAEVDDKLAKHLLQQRNARGVQHFEELDEEEADALLDALAAGDELTDDDEEEGTPPKKKIVARKKKATAKKTAKRTVRRRRKPKPVTSDDENTVDV